MQADSDGDGYISCLQALLALRSIVPAELLSDEEEIYIYRVWFQPPTTPLLPEGGQTWFHSSSLLFSPPAQILEMVDFRVTDGLVDLRLFAVIASLAEKLASME